MPKKSGAGGAGRQPRATPGAPSPPATDGHGARGNPCPAQAGPNKGKPRLREKNSSLDDLSKSPLRLGGLQRSRGEEPGPHASPKRFGVSQLPQLLAVAADAHRDLLIRQTISHLFPPDFLKPTPAPPHCGLRCRRLRRTRLTRASASPSPSQLHEGVVSGMWGNCPEQTRPRRALLVPGCPTASPALCPARRWAF